MTSKAHSHPLLFAALFFLLGCTIVIYPHWIYLLPLAALLFISPYKWAFLLLMCVGLFYTQLRYPDLTDHEDHLVGRGNFVLHAIQPSSSPFNKGLVARGVMKSFEEDSGKSYRNLPTTLWPKNGFPLEGRAWKVEGILSLNKRHHAVFKPGKESAWEVLDPRPSWAQWRYEKKEKIRTFFSRVTGDKKVASFFGAMATGGATTRLLAMEFRSLGLSHILAISGFHFALLAGLLGLVLRQILSEKWATLSLLILLTGYLLFLGISPSIFRAYVMIALFLVGRILHRMSSPLNLLGTALLIELIRNPLSLMQIGFILSYLATGGILLYYRPIEKCLQKIFPKRTLHQVKTMPLLDKHGYLGLWALRSSLALNFAVLGVTLPVTLCVFHAFPLLSLIYNLFVPPLLAFSMLLLPLCFLFPLLAKANAVYTGAILKMIENPPELIHFPLFVPNLPFSWVVAITTTIFFIGLVLYARNDSTGKY